MDAINMSRGFSKQQLSEHRRRNSSTPNLRPHLSLREDTLPEAHTLMEHVS